MFKVFWVKLVEIIEIKGNYFNKYLIINLLHLFVRVGRRATLCHALR
jgi:hypothetical protein